MSLGQCILRLLGYTSKPRLSFQASQALIHSLQELAAQEQCDSEEVALTLLTTALAQHQTEDARLQSWQLLSPREQQVAALICLNHSNRQIAARLTISPRTVKTHIRHILHKFGMPTKDQLRRSLSDWDFSAWFGS